jgi:pyruvate,water dikinase
MSGKRIIKLLSVVALVCLSFNASGQGKAPDFLNEIKSRQDFDLLKGKPLSNNYNGIECVKLVYVIATKKLYYLQSVKYAWHYTFATEILYDHDDLDWFNTVNYGQNPNRKYILATFNYNTNTKNYFVQFAPPDDISNELIATLTNKVAETFYKKDQFKILLNTTTLLRRKKELENQHQVITGDELYKSQKYQFICRGKAKGILTFINADSIKQSTDYSNCILVINGNSNTIPVCKGIITTQFQTPLSHICLLTQNRKTPCAYVKNCYNNDSLKKLNNTYVELTIGETGYTYKKMDEAVTASTARKKTSLPGDTVHKNITYLSYLSYRNRFAFGSKACNLAELQKLSKKNAQIQVPEHAFGITFFYYNRHIKANHVSDMINVLLAERALAKNDSLLSVKLKEIRKAITLAPLDSALLNTVKRFCEKHFGSKKVRFRSSSNCEDGNGFNGAGLYTSETGTLKDSVKSYERAIKKVWASLWSVRAFKEREYFNMDHSQVLMGILVHQAFDNEIANGVAVTKNLYRNYEAGFIINLQKGENEVVSPKEGVISEQVISYMNSGFAFYDASRSADWLSYSSLNTGGSLLSIEELYQLTRQLETIKRHFYELYHKWPKTEYRDFAMDVEFKLVETDDKKRKFIIKQARPYNN